MPTAARKELRSWELILFRQTGILRCPQLYSKKEHAETLEVDLLAAAQRSTTGTGLLPELWQSRNASHSGLGSVLDK